MLRATIGLAAIAAVMTVLFIIKTAIEQPLAVAATVCAVILAWPVGRFLKRS